MCQTNLRVVGRGLGWQTVGLIPPMFNLNDHPTQIPPSEILGPVVQNCPNTNTNMPTKYSAVRVKMKSVAFYSGRLQRVSDAACLHQSLAFSCHICAAEQDRKYKYKYKYRYKYKNTEGKGGCSTSVMLLAFINPWLFPGQPRRVSAIFVLQIQIRIQIWKQMPQKGICHICTAEQDHKYK